jgi:hypothetical protein
VDCQAVDWVSADRKIDGVYLALVDRLRCCDRYYYLIVYHLMLLLLWYRKWTGHVVNQVSKVRG